MPENHSPFISGSVYLKTLSNELWQLTRPLNFKNETHNIEVPEGFSTDLATIPRICWWFLSPWDIARAAIIHDWLYFNYTNDDNSLSRKECDDLFLEGMHWANPRVPKYKIYLAYYSVRVFGRFYLKGKRHEIYRRIR